MSIQFTETLLGKIDPVTMENVNTLVNEVFSNPPTDRLTDIRTDSAFYIIARDGENVAAVGGIEYVPMFAGTNLTANYFCDMAVSPGIDKRGIPYRGQGIAKEITIRRMEHAMVGGSEIFFIVADLDQANAPITSHNLEAALEPYQSRVISDLTHPDLSKVLRTKTGYKPGDTGVLIINSEGEDLTRTQQYKIPNPPGMDIVVKGLTNRISMQPERSDDQWIIYPGDHTRDYLEILGLAELPEPSNDALRFARLIQPR